MPNKRCITVFVSGAVLGAALMFFLPLLSPVLGISDAAASCDEVEQVVAPPIDPPTCHAEEGYCPRHPKTAG